MKKISNLLNNLKIQERFNKIKGSITITLSVFVLVITLLVLMNPAFTLGNHKLQLNDSLVNDTYSWKADNGYITTFDLNLNFVDSDGATINGNNISVTTDGLVADGAFTLGSTTKAEYINLLNESGLEVILTDSGKYMFDYAEVLVDGSWQRLVLDEGFESKIWCVNCLSETESEDKQYGWRGTYGTDAIEYIINESTEYKLSYIFEANSVEEELVVPASEVAVVEEPVLTFNASPEITKTVLYTARNSAPLRTDESVDSLENGQGITFTIHNYSGDNSSATTTEKPNINANGLYTWFAFRDSLLAAQHASQLNPSTDADGFGANRAKVEEVLDANDNPVFICGTGCSGLNNRSLGYLFGSNINPLGSTPIGVTNYTPNNTPLKVTTDQYGTKTFIYNSNDNAVDYDTVTNRFILRNYVERGYTLYNLYPKESIRYEFLPFNNIDSAYITTRFQPGVATNTYNYKSAAGDDQVDHWYGMTMQFDFNMPKDGLINGQPMKFEFSGDDDVWVFIDDVLVLDLGGTHGSVDGVINFNTGEVTSQLNFNETVGTLNSTYISDLYSTETVINASKTRNMNGKTFANYEKHTLKFFYLERGAAVANCKIKFNIPVLPEGSLSVKKEFEDVEKYDETYTFKVFDKTTNAPIPQGTKFTVGATKHEVTNDLGQITLGNGETALFLSKLAEEDLNNEYLKLGHTYYVQEVSSGTYALPYACNVNGEACPSVSQTQDLVMDSGTSYLTTITNKTKTYNLNVSKEAINSYEGELFDFQLSFRDENGNIVDANGLTITAPNGYTINPENNGIINFKLQTAQNITVAGLLINSVIDIQELNHDGYHASIKAIEGTTEVPLVQGDSYTVNMITENKDIKVYNTPGVELPETGGIGTLIYIVVGLSMVLASAILSIAFIRSSKVSD